MVKCRNRYRYRIFPLFLVLVFPFGCASIQVDDRMAPTVYPGASASVSTAYTKPVTAVLPLTLGLSPEAVKQYPFLVEKSVGLGVYQMVLSTVVDEGHFLVVEIRPENLDVLVSELWLRGSGLIPGNEAAGVVRQLGARQVIYGRVFDYAETVSENIVGLKAERNERVMVGVQLICTEVSSLRQIGLGSAIGYGDSVLSATHMAVEKAIHILVSRMLPSTAD